VIIIVPSDIVTLKREKYIRTDNELWYSPCFFCFVLRTQNISLGSCQRRILKNNQKENRTTVHLKDDVSIHVFATAVIVGWPIA
jgi:hypothetical protein